MKPAARLALCATLALTACSGGGISTGSILSGVTGASQPAPPANDPTARAMHGGATSARAAKCGYNFDAARLREAFLAAETRQGLQGDDLAKVGRTYDFTRAEVGKRIASNVDYCNAAKTTEIKASLSRCLAGDFAPPAPKAAVSVGVDAPSAVEPMDRERIFDPTSPRAKGILSQ